MMDERMRGVLAALANAGVPAMSHQPSLADMLAMPQQGQGMTLGDILARGSAMPPVLRRQMQQSMPGAMMPKGTI